MQLCVSVPVVTRL